MTGKEIIYKLLTKLYPTGRAFSYGRNFPIDGDAGDDGSTMRAKLDCYSGVNTDIDNVLDQILPDNDNFTTDDIINWERVLDIENSHLTDAIRKTIINARLSYPNGELYRQTAEFIQSQLQANGFDLYVHENRFESGGLFSPVGPKPTIYGTFKYGELQYGVTGYKNKRLLCNFIDKELDEEHSPVIAYKENNVFFIGGETFPNLAYVDSNRLEELYHLVLSLKPAQSAAQMMIDTNRVINGYLYNWYAVSDVNFAPAGWRFPTKADMDELITYVGGSTVAGTKLKEAGTDHWSAGNSATDDYGMSLYGSGARVSSGDFNGILTNGLYFTNDNNSPRYYTFDYNLGSVLNSAIVPQVGLSVRLIKEDNENPFELIDYDGNIYETVRIGNQIWTAQNWACTHYNNGDEIQNVTSDLEWSQIFNYGAYCAYDNDINNAIIL